MTTRRARQRLCILMAGLCLLVAGCGQKGPLYLPDDTRTASDRAAVEPAPRPRNADSGMPPTGIPTSEIPSRIERQPAGTEPEEDE